MRVAHLAEKGYFGPDPGPTIDIGLEGIRVPDFVEKFIGNSAESQVVEDSGGELVNPRANAYVANIGNKLVSVSKRRKYGYKFGIVNSDDINAFALPNGSIYATLGLLKSLKTEAELANVLGHEVGHVTHRHGLEQAAINMGTLGILEIADRVIRRKLKGKLDEVEGAEDEEGQDLINIGKGIVFGLVTSGYSRGNESESDEVGQKYASRAGWHPKGMVDVMNVFAKLEGEVNGGLDKYFRSHPYGKARAKLARHRVPKLAPGIIGRDEYIRFLIQDLGLPASEVGTAEEVERAMAHPAAIAARDEKDDSTTTWILIGVGAISALIAMGLLLRGN